MLMDEILVSVMSVQALADDLHYRSSGKNFYALHLLADRVKENLNDTIDGIKEVYFLGEIKSEPPSTDYLMLKTSKNAATVRNAATEGIDADHDLALVLAVKLATDLVIKNIEMFKKENQNLLSGTVALLDGLSQSMILANALLDRTALSF